MRIPGGITLPRPDRLRSATVEAAAASVLASLPLSAVFTQWTWFFDACVTVIALCCVGVAMRAFRVPRWAPTIAMIAFLPIILAWQFPSGDELVGVVPTSATLGHFGDLLTAVLSDLRQYSAPVPDRTGFLFLSTLGVALIAIIIDAVVVVLRQPAIAGLPMLASYSIPVAARSDSVSIVPFILGSAGFLWLLGTDALDKIRRFGRRFDRAGNEVGRSATSPLAATGRRLGLTAIIVAAVIPFASPQLVATWFDQLAASGRQNGDSATTVTLSAMLSGNLNRTTPFNMVTVQTDDTNPYYLRFGVADQITTSGFKSTPSTEGVAITDGLPAVSAATSGVTQREYRATIEIINLDARFLPLYQQPTAIDGLSSAWVYDSNTSVVYSSEETTHKLHYTVDYVRSEYSASSLRSAGAISDDELGSENTSVPDVEQVRTLVDQLAAGQGTQYDTVISIFNHFSPANGFTYQLSTKSGTSDSQIVDFLTNKQGYCVQYSAAMAWMVRQAGYPARVAFGFSRGASESNQDGTSVTLTNFNLHAWTEVYFSGVGWVPFDPTPAANVPGSANPAWAPNPGLANEPLAATPSAPATGSASSSSASGAASHSPSPTSGGHPVSNQQTSQSGIPGWVVTVATFPPLLAAILAIPWWRRRTLRHRRRRVLGSGDAVVAAHTAWDELVDSLIDVGLTQRTTETPRQLAARLAARFSDHEAALGVRRMGMAEEQARYSPHTPATNDLERSLDAVRTALIAQASRRTRLRAVLFPPSVIRRWRGPGKDHMASDGCDYPIM